MGHASVFAGFLAIAVAVVVVVLFFVGRATTPTMSGFQFAQQVAPWIPFAVAIHYATSWLGPHVAAGMTRRSFVRAAITAVLVLAVWGAVALWLLLRIERWLYGRLGWTAGADGSRVSAAETAALPYLWGLVLLLAVAGLTGLVVGLTYFRLGSVATFALPLTMIPMAALVLVLDPLTMFTLAVFTRDGRALTPPALGLGGVPASVVLGLVLLALTTGAVHLLSRRVPIRSARA